MRHAVTRELADGQDHSLALNVREALQLWTYEGQDEANRAVTLYMDGFAATLSIVFVLHTLRWCLVRQLTPRRVKLLSRHR